MTDSENKLIDDRPEGLEPQEVAVRHALLRRHRPLPDVDRELAKLMEQIDRMEQAERGDGLLGQKGNGSESEAGGRLVEHSLKNSTTWRWLWGGAAVAAAVLALFLVPRLVGNATSPEASPPIVAYEAQQHGSQDILFQHGQQAAVSVTASALRQLSARQHSAGTTAADGRTATTVVTNRLTVPSGMVAEVTLPDGTEVWVNAASRLEYPETFEGSERTVTLRGEAYFKVVHDAAHPFVVKTEGMSTRVLGTEFNVRAYHAEPSHVTLLKGSVEVTASEAKCLVKPGEDVQVEGSGSMAVSRPDTETFTAWKQGEFYFDNATLWDIAREMGRWYNVSVVFNDPADMHLRLFFSADRSSSLQEIVELLNGLNKAKVGIKDGQMVIG